MDVRAAQAPRPLLAHLDPGLLRQPLMASIARRSGQEVGGARPARGVTGAEWVNHIAGG